MTEKVDNQVTQTSEPAEMTPKEKLKRTSPNILASTNPPLVTIARDGGIVCPFCGNGSGKDGTGVKPDLTAEGYRYYCHKPHIGGESQYFDNIDIAAQAFRLPINGEENRANFKKVIDKALELIDACPAEAPVHYAPPAKIPQTNQPKAAEPKTPTDYTEFYKTAYKNLHRLFKKHNLKTWRGLTLETLEHYFCGYDPCWGKYKTPRMIIPSARTHYLARLDDTFNPLDSEKKKLVETKVISAKQHYGTKTVFGMHKVFSEKHTPEWETLHGKNGYTCRHLPNKGHYDSVFIVEGEIDAMTGYQVSGYDFLAISGSVISKDMAEELIFGGKNFKTVPATFIVLMDNDDAGRAAAPNIANKLITLGHKAIIADWRAMDTEGLLRKANGEECKDLNECLTSGCEKNLKHFLDLCDTYASYMQAVWNEFDCIILDGEGDFDDFIAKTNRSFWTFFTTELCKKDPIIPDCNLECANCILCKFKPPTVPIHTFCVEGLNLPLLDTGDEKSNDAKLSKKQTSKEAIPSCPIDLEIPDGFKFGVEGVAINGSNPICYMPVVVTRELRDADTNLVSTELSYYNEAQKRWRSVIVPNEVIMDHRKIADITKHGIHFPQKAAKSMTDYLVGLITNRKNRAVIPQEILHNRTGWLDNECTQFIYPDKTFEGHALNGATDFFKGKFTAAGDKAAWRKEILRLFNYLPSLPVFNVVLGAVLAAPMLKYFGVRNPQILLWCPTGSGKSALVKAVMSVYGNPELLKNTFNCTPYALDGLLEKFCDLPCWIDEYQSASTRIRQEIGRIIYSFAEAKTRARLSQRGVQLPTFSIKSVRIMTAEEPIISDNANAGMFNRLLTFSRKDLLPANENVPKLHRFFEKNHGYFGYEWISYVADPANREPMKNLFEANRAIFEDYTITRQWTNGWADVFAIILTALQTAIPLLDSGITAEIVSDHFFKKFDTISDEVPKTGAASNYKRALTELEDYVNAHPRFFKYEETVKDERGVQWTEMDSATDGSAYQLQGYCFLDGAIGFIPTEFKKIIEKELGFTSSKAILRDFHEHGIIKCNYSDPSKGGYTLAKNVPKYQRLVYVTADALAHPQEKAS